MLYYYGMKVNELSTETPNRKDAAMGYTHVVHHRTVTEFCGLPTVQSFRIVADSIDEAVELYAARIPARKPMTLIGVTDIAAAVTVLV